MMKTVEEQMKIITSGAMSIVGEEELKEKLERAAEENRPLNIKLGLDPSAPDIHIGHAVVLRKVKQMQDLGHKVIIIIGDFTGKIGDPTGKSKTRKQLTDEEVIKNAKTYEDQIFKILDRDKTEVRFNSEWLAKLSFEDVIRLAATTTVARVIERDDFKNRFNNGMPIGIHELFYPLMQAYDSVAVNADIEIGGSDQTFNILMGRTLQKHFGQMPQVAVFMPILEGLDGVEKMSKSLLNYIGINEDAKTIFKKVMEIPDNLIVKYFELATDEHPDAIMRISKELEEGKNPKDVKYELAKIITSLYHDTHDTEVAVNYYNEAFSKKGVPSDIPEFVIAKSGLEINSIVTELVEAGFVSSNSEFRRLITQGGVRINSEKCDSISAQLWNKDVIKIGKKKFIKIVSLKDEAMIK